MSEAMKTIGKMIDDVDNTASNIRKLFNTIADQEKELIGAQAVYQALKKIEPVCDVDGKGEYYLIPKDLFEEFDKIFGENNG